MNKEIIIDGVNVSQCPKYATNEEFNLEKAKGKDLCLNCAGVECFFKKYELLKIQNQQQYIEFKNKEINYEKIKNMTVEEMVEFFAQKQCCELCSLYEGFDDTYCKGECEAGIMGYLQSQSGVK